MKYALLVLIVLMTGCVQRSVSRDQVETYIHTGEKLCPRFEGYDWYVTPARKGRFTITCVNSDGTKVVSINPARKR